MMMSNTAGLFIPKDEDVEYFTIKRNEALERFNDGITQNLEFERIENRYRLLMRRQKQLYLIKDVAKINNFVKKS